MTGCVKREYHRETRILMCIPEAHESKQRICCCDANRDVWLSLDGDYEQAGSGRAVLPWRLLPVARDDWN